MTSWPAVDEQYLAAQTATLGFSLGLPKVVAIAPDGDVLFLRTPPRSFVADLYQLDAATGAIAKLATADGLLAGQAEQLSDAERARRERTRTVTRGIVDVELSEDGNRLVIPLGERVFVLDRQTGASREVHVDGYPYDPHLSPDGGRLGWVKDGDVYVVDVAGGKPHRLTTRPSETVEHGVAEFAAQEELGRRRGWWWSPDGAFVAYQRTDNTKVDTLWVADPRHPEKAPVPFKYPRAGTTNADVTLGVTPTKGGATTWIDWDRTRWPYLASVTWPEKGALTLVVLDRPQNHVAVLAADPTSGKTTVLLEEHDDAWINLPPGGPHWLPDGSGFLWMTERGGAWQLELRGKDGALVRTLTKPALGLQKLLGLDEDSGTIWLSASTDPVQDHVWKLPLAGGEPEQVTRDSGMHNAEVGHKGGTVVVGSTLRDGRVVVTARRAKGEPVELPSAAEVPPYWPSVAIETVEVDGREFQAAITRPRAFEAGRRYPVLLKVYGGPHAQMVYGSARSYLGDQFYADAGFIVVRIDGRGTPARGRDWERVYLKDFITVPLTDQVDGLTALAAKHPELDLSRVGVFGWSFGGYLSAMAVLMRPDFFRCGVAGAPVTDWALYDTAYTERYMKLPADNPDGYAKSSALTHAADLKNPLLLIHGMTDDNVHFAHSLALMEALFRAGKRAELVTLSATHMVPDPKLALAREQIILDFFRAHLGEAK